LKTFTRISLIFIIIGFSLLLAGFPRSGQNQISTSFYLDHGQTISESLGVLPPSYLYLTFQTTNSSIDFSLATGKAYSTWSKGEGNLSTLWHLQNSSSGSVSIQLPYRDMYYVVVTNYGGNNTQVLVIGAVYGYEQDLLQIAVAVIAIGFAVGAASFFVGKYRILRS